jgi:alpha-beta hydrolase superfamily lysophospholipase
MNQIQYQEVHGKQIATYFSKTDDSSKKVIIMSHGFRCSSLGPARQFVDFQRILNKNGYSVLRFDQPNSANSEGDYLDSSFKAWVKTTTFFANKYLNEGYEVSLLGQSMGATTTVIATNQPEVKGKISCILLWVPDAKSTANQSPDEIFEECGQKYKGKFWLEARDFDFFKCLDEFKGGIHLVYGEFDKYVKKEVIQKTIEMVKHKGFSVMTLKGQEHSPWAYDLVQNVYEEELKVLDQYMK